MPEEMCRIFSALSDPTRLAIVERLTRGEATVQELAQPFEISAPAISRHLRVLEQAGLIERGRAAQTRPCRLAPGRLKQVADWTQRMRSVWEDRFARMDDYLAELTDKEDGKR